MQPKTKTERDILVKELETLLNTSEVGNSALNTASIEKVKDTISTQTYDFLCMQVSRPAIQDKVSVKDLVANLKALETVFLELYINPTAAFVQKLHSAIAKFYDVPILIDISVNKEIIGGLIVSSSSGDYRDLSLHKTLENLYSGANKESLVHYAKV